MAVAPCRLRRALDTKRLHLQTGPATRRELQANASVCWRFTSTCASDWRAQDLTGVGAEFYAKEESLRVPAKSVEEIEYVYHCLL